MHHLNLSYMVIFLQNWKQIKFIFIFWHWIENSVTATTGGFRAPIVTALYPSRCCFYPTDDYTVFASIRYGIEIHIFSPCIFILFRLMSRLRYGTCISNAWRVSRPCIFLLLMLKSLNVLRIHSCKHWYTKIMSYTHWYLIRTPVIIGGSVQILKWEHNMMCTHFFCTRTTLVKFIW